MDVVAAIIVKEGKILCMKRGKAKFDYLENKYEFPGGKVEKGENHVEALKRELKEEMDLEIDISDLDFFLTVEHNYKDFHISLHTYLCNLDSCNFNRKEHIYHKWLDACELETIQWAGADYPVIEKLKNKRD